MDNRLKQEFTRRLSQCNNGELIIIMYDIVFAYMNEARAAYAENLYEEYKSGVKKTQVAVNTLCGALDLKYGIAKDLHRLYTYVNTCLAKSIYQNRLEGMDEAEKILKRLYASFCEAAKSDTSGPLMRNTQQVYAGMTYGRTTLNENCVEENHRGFFV